MLTLADLDAPGGVEKFARACAERSACMASLRFFAQATGLTLAASTGSPVRDAVAVAQEA